MKKNTMFKIIFLSLILSSCGLIERFKTPEQPSDTMTEEASSETASSETPTTDADDLFSQSMDSASASTSETAATDSPSNVDSDLKSLESEFSGTASSEVQVKEEIPEIKEEPVAMASNTSSGMSGEGGTIQTYRVQKGETLMQIAFKIYGDIGKWKDIKAMNRGQLSSNNSLRTNMELKYMAPETPFVWNPVGVPYMIKSGETLGTISNTVYSTPKKWKSIYENNRPLIKNPNVIFAGFTLYYKKNPSMANYVQPAAAQPKSAAKTTEEVIVEELMNEDKTSAAKPTIESLTTDEAAQIQAAPARPEIQEGEIDLINNVSAPIKDEAVQGINSRDLPPMIDEEIQTLE